MVPLFILLFILPATLPAAELIVWGVPKDRGLMAALRLFEAEHPGWELVTSAGSSGGMDPQKLMCGIAGGSPPDMLQQDRFSVGEWAVREAFGPLCGEPGAEFRAEYGAATARQRDDLRSLDARQRRAAGADQGGLSALFRLDEGLAF